MAILDGLLDYDAETVLAQVVAPCWLLAAIGDDEWSRSKQAALDAASRVLARPRAFALHGALHDVPLQWPALVAGVVRAAADEHAPAATEGHER
jgi:hypothetical protein